ncbi:uncharacterized protein [Cherax quadricarinatus]|uniref:uncharacterized protein isoform X3 n=1 Tax=Cherax quadricarinatus TaxID=27406 RepID=UPI00387EB4CC
MTLCITVLVLVLILVPATPLSVYHECLPQAKWSIRWEGSHVEATVWLTEEGAMTDPEQSLLTFIMEPISSSSPYNYDVLRMNRRHVEIVRFRNGRQYKSELSLSQPLPVGWATFNLSSTSLTELWLLPHTKLVSLSADITIASLTIQGSNITVGCHNNEFGWKVVDGGAVTVPLSHRHCHYLSTYSNTASQPRLTLRQTAIQLGWDGSTFVDMTHYDNKNQNPLPAVTEHHLVISCNSSNAEFFICNIQAGKTILKTVNFKALPTSVTIQGKLEEQFYVFYHRVNDIVTDDLVSSSAAGDDGNHAYKDYFKATEDVSVQSVLMAMFLVALHTIAVVAVFAVFVISAYFAVKACRHFTKKRTDQTISLENADSAGEQLLSDMFQEQHELQNVDTLLKNTIITGKADRVKTLLRQTDNRHDAYVEAHIQAKKDIIQIISVKENEGIEIPDNNLISRVINVLQKRINKVFRAASVGIYRGGGVKTLLESYGLPGTIRDKRGCSLLHYMAETLNEDGSPIWSYDDINDYLDTEEYYINAVDYKGQTVLHTLAGHQQISKKVMWNEKDQPLEDVWCAMAKMFIKKGCNPTLRNHSGRSSVDIAMDKGATKFVNILIKVPM